MRLTSRRTLLRICGISLLPLSLWGQTPADTLSHELKEVVVASQATTTSVALGPDGAMRWDTHVFDLLPRILGNADPIHYAQMLPGVQTNSELDAGLHIQGSDQGHTLFTLSGVPVYNATHLLGLFSVFNASHYTTMTLKKGANEASDPSRLGGALSMNLSTHYPDTVSGELSMGLISSQGTLRLPTGSCSGLTLSARTSYLNLLYSRWLNSDDMKVHYRFYDLNGTWQWQPAPNHRLWVDTYMGNDRLHLKQSEYDATLRLNWGNRMVSAHYLYDCSEDMNIHTTLYYTRNENILRLSQADMVFRLPSDISDLGLCSKVHWHGLSTGIEGVWHNVLPQAPRSENIYTQIKSTQSRQHTQEYTLFADYTRSWRTYFEGTVGMRATTYVDDGRQTYFVADPSLRLAYRRGLWQLAADYALRHQFLFLTGTTSLGMPTEFWMSSNAECLPQWAHHAALSASLYLFDGKYRLSVDAYYTRLYHQVEYDGDMMKFLNADYRLAENLLHGNGYNYGMSVMLSRRTGKVTGWVSYAYGRARRKFIEDGFSHSYPASHERPHEVNALLTWQINRHWNVAATYVFASGTPFTAPESFYLMNGMLLASYGPHNARRLRPYNRLDFSLNYLLPSRHLRESGFNLSLYNATMNHNDITCCLKVYKGRYHYSHYALIKFILPSVSYFLKF